MQINLKSPLDLDKARSLEGLESLAQWPELVLHLKGEEAHYLRKLKSAKSGEEAAFLGAQLKSVSEVITRLISLPDVVNFTLEQARKIEALKSTT